VILRVVWVSHDLMNMTELHNENLVPIFMLVVCKLEYFSKI